MTISRLGRSERELRSASVRRSAFVLRHSPEVGNAPEPHVPAACHDACRRAGRDCVEALSEDRRRVRPARARAILEQADEFRVLGENTEIGRERFFQKLRARLNGAQRQILQQPRGFLRDVEDRLHPPMRLDHEEPPAVIHADGDGILEHRLGRPQLGLQARRELEFLQSNPRRARHCIRRLRRHLRRTARRAAPEQDEQCDSKKSQ